MRIKTHTTYRIAAYRPSMNPVWRHKLLAMGMLPGTLLEVIRVAPLGDPVQIRIRKVTLAIRQSELSALRLEAV